MRRYAPPLPLLIIRAACLYTFSGFCFCPAPKVHLLKLRSEFSTSMDRKPHRKTPINIDISPYQDHPKIYPAAHQPQSSQPPKHHIYGTLYPAHSMIHKMLTKKITRNTRNLLTIDLKFGTIIVRKSFDLWDFHLQVE